MPQLLNSQRRIYKETYTPIRPDDSPDDQEKLKKVKRAWDKINFVRSLAIREGEIPRIKILIEEQPDEGQRKTLTKVLDLASTLLEDHSPAHTMRHAPKLAEFGQQALLEFGDLLVKERRTLKQEINALLNEILSAYLDYLKQTAGSTGDASTEEAASNQPDDSEEGDSEHLIGVAIAWAMENDDPRAQKLDELATALNIKPVVYSKRDVAIHIKQLARNAFNWTHSTQKMVNGFKERMNVQPVGRKHLERLEMTPAGVERGELVYSVPLAPKETVHISHKEWSIRTEEFAKTVEDHLEEFSEEGVTEKNDLAQSTETQQKDSKELSVSGTGTYMGVSVTVGFKSTSDDQRSEKESRNQSIAITRKASTRTRQDHKVSFKVTSVAGSEDQTVRRITNPSETAAMRVDYYQLMRKWRVDLYRYGVRMTYDIVIPNPGADLIRKIEEVRALDEQIEVPFKFQLATTDIDLKNFRGLAARFGATVEDPPKQSKILSDHREYPEDTRELFDAIDFEVDPDYEIASGFLLARFDPSSSDEDFEYAFFDVLMDGEEAVWAKDFPDIEAGLRYRSDLKHLVGRTGRVSTLYVIQNLRGGTVYVEFDLKLTPSAYQRWRLNAWNAFRQAAEERYYQSRQTLIERRDKLVQEMNQFDAFTLRKMEHEEIMKGVLRWLFGPDFELMSEDVRGLFKAKQSQGPASASVALNPQTLTNASWEKVMEFGEFIKFIHHAIEWENVLYFLYPYFWDSPQNWKLKRFLYHPDALHRDFLRAGAARVVLTIRRGFAKEFATLMETGCFGTIEEHHPYIKIAEEIENYANTHYPGIPPANPENADDEQEVENKERGKLIGRWYEYTPTSALDISLNTVLAELA